MTQQTLQQRLQALADKPASQRLCSLARLMSNYDQDTQEILQRILDSDVSNSQIARELLSEPGHPDRNTIGNHRNKRCACYVNA